MICHISLFQSFITMFEFLLVVSITNITYLHFGDMILHLSETFNQCILGIEPLTVRSDSDFIQRIGIR